MFYVAPTVSRQAPGKKTSGDAGLPGIKRFTCVCVWAMPREKTVWTI